MKGFTESAKFKNFKQNITEELFSSEKNNIFLNKLRVLYRQLTIDLGKDWHPYVNGRYMIFMQHGTWINHISEVPEDKRIFSEYTYKLFANNFSRDIFTRLATDIDLPQLNNEYLTLSTRNQGITYFHRQTLLPDFTISYIENQKDLDIIQYHDLWFKMMELYRRGELRSSTIKSNKCKYFYEVPYLNAVWVIIFDIAFNIRGLIYLIGVKPVNHPLRDFLGNRSNSKITVYNIQYKTTNMYYSFFKNTKDFLEAYNSSSSLLLSRFKSFVNDFIQNKDLASIPATVSVTENQNSNQIKNQNKKQNNQVALNTKTTNLTKTTNSTTKSTGLVIPPLF